MITLPKVEEVPECANDKMVYKTIVSIFKKYREQYEAPISEFDNELLWLLNFVDNRAVNKPYVLFKCGFVFHQEKVGINITRIATTISLTNMQVSQRVKGWITQVWDITEKKMLLFHFRNNCDLRTWSLRKINKDNCISEFVLSKISLQTPQPVNEVNLIPPPLIQPVTSINTKIIDMKHMSNFIVCSKSPKQWVFNQESKKNFVLF